MSALRLQRKKRLAKASRKLALATLLFFLSNAEGAPPPTLRVATFNCTLNRTDIGGELTALLGNATFAKGKQVAEIIQRVRPDVLLLNEFDYSPTSPGTALSLFQQNFLAVSQSAGLQPIAYGYQHTAPVNTGIASGQDLDNNGSVDSTPGDATYAGDAFGFGRWSGQYGMAVFSKYPVLTANFRSFQLFKWKDMPGNALPTTYYTTAEQNIFRLSSKSHWDLPIDLGSGAIFHLLASHPTPPVFDGPEDRNGRRNYDEIRLWADYLTGNTYLTDDSGQAASLASTERFCLLGDQNADPVDGDSYQKAILQLLQHPRVNASETPRVRGNSDTATFGLRADYVLPSRSGWRVTASGIFWPTTGEPGLSALAVSDHRLVWLDLTPVPVLADALENFQTTTATSHIGFSWVGKASYTYAVETSLNPAGPWTPSAATPTNPAGNQWQATLPVEPGSRRFYRLAVSWP
jgi:hypothetical protein